jgi:DNA-binding MarR family transcriptional regulator
MSEPVGLTLRLKHAEQAVRRAIDHVLVIEGLTFEQWQVLAALSERPGLRMTELAEFACLPAATLTRHVDHLAGLALVIRRIDPADRRRAVVALSVRGEGLAARLLVLEQGVDVAIGALDTTAVARSGVGLA